MHELVTSSKSPINNPTSTCGAASVTDAKVCNAWIFSRGKNGFQAGQEEKSRSSPAHDQKSCLSLHWVPFCLAVPQFLLAACFVFDGLLADVAKNLSRLATDHQAGHVFHEQLLVLVPETLAWCILSSHLHSCHLVAPGFSQFHGSESHRSHVLGKSLILSHLHLQLTCSCCLACWMVCLKRYCLD